MGKYATALFTRLAIIIIVLLGAALIAERAPPIYGSVAIFALVALILLYYLANYIANGKFSLWVFGKMKSLGWIAVEPKLELAPGEKILHPPSSAYIRFQWTSAMCSDIIITDKRVAVGLVAYMTKEVFGELNLWQRGLDGVPKLKKNRSTPLDSLMVKGDFLVKAASLSKKGDNVEITINQHGMDFKTIIFHHRAKEICEILSR